MIGYHPPLAALPSFLRPGNFFFFFTAFLIISVSAYASDASTPLCLSNQSSTLLHFKRGIALTPGKLSSWKKGSDCCDWEGVACDKSGFVTELQIPGVSQTPRGYDGSSSSRVENSSFTTLARGLSRMQHLNLDDVSISISGESVSAILSSSMPDLRILSLSNCSISGTMDESNGSIPSSWASKRIAEVYLSNNNLNGSIPEGFCSSSNLTILYLFGNSLSGTIPSCLFNMPSLVEIDLSYNLLSSVMSLPLFNLPNVTTIDLSHNLLSGSIHSSFYNLPVLQYLKLNDNRLTGKITATIVNLPKLWELYLSNNNLTGSIPSFLFNLPYLWILDLENNSFTGSLPYVNQSWGLEHLWLANNCLSGVIPSSINTLSSLIAGVLSWNCFNGTVNLSPFVDLEQLKLLDFSNNKGLTALESSNYSYDSFRGHSLSILDLSSCNLKSFPTFLQKLPLYYLKVDLSNNGIRGEIPSWLWGISGIDTLLLDFNEIEGFEAVNKSSISDDLHYFSASLNHITGEIPTFICNFTQLSVLDMSSNNLTGTIPNCLDSPNLGVLGLANNQLEGQIPVLKDTFVSLVSLNNNLLSGKIEPEALNNCTNLQLLDLGDNQLSGTFPSWLSSYVNLKVLVLRSNHLHGPITLSGSTQMFPSLHIFDISGNHFSGSLPHELFRSLKAMVANESKGEAHDDHGIGSFLDFLFISSILVESSCPECSPSKMTYYMAAVEQTIKRRALFFSQIDRTLAIIDLSNNMFSNKIPEDIGMLNGLRILNISNNNLSGTIPKSLGNLKWMEALDLSHNHLSGAIPVELTKLTSLAVLNLSYNELQGRIPEGNQFNTFDETSFEGNRGLCGSQVHRPCSSGTVNDGVHQQAFVEREYGALGFGFAVGILMIVVPIMLNARVNYWYWNIIDRILEFITQAFLYKAFKCPRHAV